MLRNNTRSGVTGPRSERAGAGTQAGEAGRRALVGRGRQGTQQEPIADIHRVAWEPPQGGSLDSCCLKRQQASKNGLETAHSRMPCFLPLKILSLPLPHLIYARAYEEVKASIYYKGVFVFVLQIRNMKHQESRMTGKSSRSALFFRLRVLPHFAGSPFLASIRTGLARQLWIPAWGFVPGAGGAVRPGWTAESKGKVLTADAGIEEALKYEGGNEG